MPRKTMTEQLAGDKGWRKRRRKIITLDQLLNTWHPPVKGRPARNPMRRTFKALTDRNRWQ